MPKRKDSESEGGDEDSEITMTPEARRRARDERRMKWAMEDDPNLSPKRAAQWLGISDRGLPDHPTTPKPTPPQRRPAGGGVTTKQR